MTEMKEKERGHLYLKFLKHFHLFENGVQELATLGKLPTLCFSAHNDTCPHRFRVSWLGRNFTLAFALNEAEPFPSGRIYCYESLDLPKQEYKQIQVLVEFDKLGNARKAQQGATGYPWHTNDDAYDILFALIQG